MDLPPYLAACRRTHVEALGRLPGRLSYITVVGGTIFATLSGSTMANTAMMGALMVPEMTARGYKRHMSMGPILGTGGLAMIIPPSALAVLLASLAEIDIGKLLIAGVLPGLVLAVLYSILIYAQVKLDPGAAPFLLDPRASRAEFDARGWRSVVGFQTHHNPEANPQGYVVTAGDKRIAYSGDTGWFDHLTDLVPRVANVLASGQGSQDLAGDRLHDGFPIHSWPCLISGCFISAWEYCRSISSILATLRA